MMARGMVYEWDKEEIRSPTWQLLVLQYVCTLIERSDLIIINHERASGSLIKWHVVCEALPYSHGLLVSGMSSRFNCKVGICRGTRPGGIRLSIREVTDR